MEYLEAVDLVELLESQSPKQRRRIAFWVISRVLEALHYLHSQGIVHRDVKPSNVLAYREKHRLQVKVADFGLAKLFADAGFSGLTSENSVRGTLAYMSPEQFNNSREAGPADDLFSCGATLYRLLVGECPNMIAEPATTLSRIDAVGLLEQDVSLIKKAIARDASKRFQTIAEFAEAVQSIRGSIR